jgi:hypothetical protein
VVLERHFKRFLWQLYVTGFRQTLEYDRYFDHIDCDSRCRDYRLAGLSKKSPPIFKSIRSAGRRRLRPIRMTATTTMLALAPLAIGAGEGSEAQAPMARSVIGGLLSATMITLILIPTVYSLPGRRSETDAAAKRAVQK